MLKKREYFWVYREYFVRTYPSRKAAEKSCLFETGWPMNKAIEMGWKLERRTTEIVLEKARHHV